MLSGIGWGSLRTKIIAWSFVPTAIILAAVAWVTFSAYRQATEDMVIERDREQTHLSSGELAAGLSEYSSLLAEYSSLLANLVREAYVADDALAAPQQALMRARKRFEVFDGGAVVIDDQGIVVATDPERLDILGRDWSYHTYYRQARLTLEPVFSGIVTDGPKGSKVIVVAVPIRGDQDQFTGIMAGMFRLEEATESPFYREITQLHTSGTTYLVDSNGRVIFHSDPTYIGDDFYARPMVQEVLNGETGALRTRDANGQEVVISFSPVPGTSWGLVSEENWGTLNSPAQGRQRFLLVLLALGIIVPTLVVAVGVRQITKPVTELINAAQKVAGGEFDHEIDTRAGGEIGELARQFNLMSNQLQESYANLEQRVADRTRELTALNDIAATVSQSLDLTEVLDDALAKTLEVIEVQSGGIYLLGQETRELTLAAHRGFSPQSVSKIGKLAVDTGFPGCVAQSGRPLVTDNVDTDLRLSNVAAIDEGLRSMICVPLISKGIILGTLFATTRAHRKFAERDVQLLTSIGHQVGVTVENARLYEQAQQLAVMQERSRLARELHDAVTQTLFSASLIAEALPNIWESDQEEGRQLLTEMRRLSRGALAEMRTLLLELRPAVLVEARLSDLLIQLAEAITGREDISIEVTVEECALSPDVHVALYRIAQEALNNVAKHARAGQIDVVLRHADHAENGGAMVELCISDDGCGFDTTCIPPDRLGLSIMRERAQAIGAELEIESKADVGTQVLVVWKENA